MKKILIIIFCLCLVSMVGCRTLVLSSDAQVELLRW